MSSGINSVWGFDNVIAWVNTSGIAQTIEEAILLVNISGDEQFAISLVSPSVFHKSIFGNVVNQINIHIDLIIQEEDTDKTLYRFIDVVKKDFLQDTEKILPVQFKIFGDITMELSASEFLDKNLDLVEPVKSARLIISKGIYKKEDTLIEVTKTYTLFMVWKKLGKLFCSSYGTVALLNLFQGVLINPRGAEFYESILFQSTLVDQEVMTSKKGKHRDGNRNISIKFSNHHPTVLSSIQAVCDKFLSTSHALDLYKFTHGLILDCFLNARDIIDYEELLQDIAHLHRSSSGKLNCLASCYEILANYARYSTEDPKLVVKYISFVLKTISQRLHKISNRVEYSVITKWYAQCLENNIFILEEMLHHRDQFQNIPKFLEVEKVSCFVATLKFQQYALSSLKHLSHKLGTFPDNVISQHLSLMNVSHSTSSEVPVPKFGLGLYEPNADKPFHFGIDIIKNATKIKSAANMHTIAVLIQYQCDMYIDQTIKSSMNSISNDLPSNPYNCMIKDCLLSSYKVDADCIHAANVSKSLIHKPRLKDQGHQIYSIRDTIFGLHHTVFQADPEGVFLILGICKVAQNKPYITKKDGIRIMHAIYPHAEQLVCGKLNPMVYTYSCDECYVMIKEAKSASAELGLAFLTEMLFLHLVDLSNHHIVVGYCVDKGDVILLNMNNIQSNSTERTTLMSEINGILEARSLLTFEYFVQIELGCYVKIIKDIKPIFADPAVQLYDHYTPSNPLNSNFAVFSKLYTATFFYDYAESTSEEDIQFAINNLNHKIVENGDSWSVYQPIMLKYMLEEDVSFQVTAFHAAHSPCSKLHGLQQLNSIISELIDNKLTANKSLDVNIVKDMVLDLVVHCKETLKHICASVPLVRYLNIYLTAIYNDGEPVLDENLEKLLKALFVAMSSLAQYFEKEYLNSTSYKFQQFVSEAASQI